MRGMEDPRSCCCRCTAGPAVGCRRRLPAWTGNCTSRRNGITAKEWSSLATIEESQRAANCQAAGRARSTKASSYRATAMTAHQLSACGPPVMAVARAARKRRGRFGPICDGHGGRVAWRLPLGFCQACPAMTVKGDNHSSRPVGGPQTLTALSVDSCGSNGTPKS